MKISNNDLCLCKSTKKYKKCCKIFHENITKPKTALELMRSRYCAFALNLSEYIIKTTHKENQDYTNDILNWKQDIENFSINTECKNRAEPDTDVGVRPDAKTEFNRTVKRS